MKVFVRGTAETAGAVPFDGARYQHEERGLNVEYGKAAQHCCIYTLTVLNDKLGTLTFSRATPFSEEDTERLEFLQRESRHSDPGVNALIALGAVAADRPLPPLKLPHAVGPIVRAATEESP